MFPWLGFGHDRPLAVGADPFEPVEAYETHALGVAQHLIEEGHRSARNDGHHAKPLGQSDQEVGHLGQRTGGRRVFDDEGERAVKVQQQRARCRVLAQGLESGRELGARTLRHGQEAAVTRSAPASTTTSMPAMPGTGTCAVSGCTAVGCNPNEAAMAAAAGCSPAA